MECSHEFEIVGWGVWQCVKCGYAKPAEQNVTVDVTNFDERTQKSVWAKVWKKAAKTWRREALLLEEQVRDLKANIERRQRSFDAACDRIRRQKEELKHAKKECERWSRLCDLQEEKLDRYK